MVAIVGHGGSIGWTMPFFAGNVTTDFAFAHGLHNTDIVQVVLDKVGNPLVSDWAGIPFGMSQPAPVPLPATGLLLVAALGSLGAGWMMRRRAA